MAIYKCEICGHQYDEEKERVKFEDLPEDWKCSICGAPKYLFKKVKEESKEMEEKQHENQSGTSGNESVDHESLDYPKAFKQESSEYERYMRDIQQMALTGETIIEPMGTKLPLISWEDILIMGAQLNPVPLDTDAKVNVKTIIGKKAKRPMELDMPVYISHMSFGALSKEIKIALAKGSSMAKTAMCSGEGGILPEERENAYKYIFEYVPNLYSVTDENLQNVDAIEIKIGQGTKPGMGGHLPKEKVTEEIAKIRNKLLEMDIHSPSKFSDIQTKEDLKNLVDQLRKRSKGRPIGIKIAAGNIEKDMEWIAFAAPDFITVDGRGGATGASPKFLRDSSSIPTIFALYRAKKYMLEHHLNIDLVITGGLRISSDFAKAISMGADCIAIASSALMASACQQYRVCQSGNCPMGVATQDLNLRRRLDIDKSAKRLYNFLKGTKEELETYGRITGNKDIFDLSTKNLKTTNAEISEYTDIEHV